MQDQIKVRQIDQTLINLRISTHPHLENSEQKDFADMLFRQRRLIMGEESEELDRAGLAKLKEVLKKESKLIKVK